MEVNICMRNDNRLERKREEKRKENWAKIREKKRRRKKKRKYGQRGKSEVMQYRRQNL